VPREHHRDDLVAKLNVVHLRARGVGGVFVDRLHQHAEEVVAEAVLRALVTRGLLATVANEPVHDPVERTHRAVEPDVVRRRDGRRDPHDRLGVVVRPAKRGVERAADLACISVDVRREQREADDAKREPHHLFVHAERLEPVVPPAIEHRPRRLGHLVGEVTETRAMKRGLRELSLPSPHLTLAREEPLAEDDLEPHVVAALLVRLRVVDQDVMDHVGIREHVVVPRTELEANDVAVLPVRLEHQPQGIAPRREHAPEQRQPSRARSDTGRRDVGSARVGHRMVFRRSNVPRT